MTNGGVNSTRAMRARGGGVSPSRSIRVDKANVRTFVEFRLG